MQESSHEPIQAAGPGPGRGAAGTRFGRYEVAAELGRGAMGVVYRARDPIIDRVVALKTIESGRTGAAAASFTERFFQEARSAGRLNHPNIVTIYDAGEAEGQAYIAMEFLEGTSLREMLDEQGVLPVHRAVELAGQVARGLGYAHEHGVIHRDVKPANIIVLRNRRPKITDFGIARLGEADVLAGDRAGSPKYMSPEQIRGDAELDGRSDIFSLGTVFYEMLTGRQPFNGDGVLAIMRSVLEDAPEPPSLHNRRVPPELDAVVMRMLAKRPEERFPSARWLFRELRQLEERLEKESEAPRNDRASSPRVSPDDPTLILGAAPAPTAPARERSAWKSFAGAIAAVLAVIAIASFALREVAAPAAVDRPVLAAPPVETTPAPVVAAVPAAPEPPRIESKPPPPAAQPKPALAARKKPVPAPAPVVAPPPAPEPVVVQAPPPPPAPVARETARLQLAVSPWGEVYVDGKLRGTTPPLTELELAPGRHRLEIRNSSQLPYLTVLDVRAGDTRQVQHRFAN